MKQWHCGTAVSPAGSLTADVNPQRLIATGLSAVKQTRDRQIIATTDLSKSPVRSRSSPKSSEPNLTLAFSIPETSTDSSDRRVGLHRRRRVRLSEAQSPSIWVIPAVNGRPKSSALCGAIVRPLWSSKSVLPDNCEIAKLCSTVQRPICEVGLFRAFKVCAEHSG